MFQIEKLSLDVLIPYENNPRINDKAVETVANSIKEFGFNVPIIIDKDNVIVAGHTRYEACKILGLDSVPCHRVENLTDEQVKAYRLADNKTAELADWDFSKLEVELAGLEFDMGDFGFNAIEKIDWAEVEDLSDDTYEEPKKDLLQCPNCKHVDSKGNFRKITSSNDLKQVRIDGFSIRNATLNDIDEIKRIADKNSQQIGFVLRPALEEHCKKDSLLVAEHEGKIVGFCNFNKRKKDGVNVIYEICVDYKYRGNGIGKKLIDSMERPISLKCPVDNESNNFYRAYGFVNSGVEDGKKRRLNVWELR